MKRTRLDTELVRRGLARSREHAAELIRAGRVTVQGRAASKPATQVDTAAAIVVKEAAEGPDYVSRGAYKLAGALEVFGPRGLTVRGRRCLDAGASTGGFTDVLLRNGAAHVIAVDVGYGQLAWSLRIDERVTVMERVNVRDLTPELGGRAARPDRRRPVVHLAAAGAAAAARVRGAHGRLRAAGQAAVRGGQGEGGRRWRGPGPGAARRRPCSTWPGPPRSSAWPCGA